MLTQSIKDGYVIVKFENGCSMKYPQTLKTSDLKETIGNTPNNPIEELSTKVDLLGAELTKAKMDSLKKDEIINELGKELTQLKLERNGN